MRHLHAAVLSLVLGCFNPSGSSDTGSAVESTGYMDSTSAGRTSSGGSSGDGSTGITPICGDGIVQPPEECDNSTDSCTPECTLTYRRVFVTDGVFTADLGGAEGANAKCQAEADAAGIPGKFAAWLGPAPPAETFLQSKLPYRRLDGQEVAADWDDLVDGMLTNPINVTPKGLAPMPTFNECNDLPRPNAVAWTNLTPLGVVWTDKLDCEGFTSPSMQSIVGAGDPNATDAAWTQKCNVICSESAALYCFEQ